MAISLSPKQFQGGSSCRTLFRLISNADSQQPQGTTHQPVREPTVFPYDPKLPGVTDRFLGLCDWGLSLFMSQHGLNPLCNYWMMQKILTSDNDSGKLLSNSRIMTDKWVVAQDFCTILYLSYVRQCWDICVCSPSNCILSLKEYSINFGIWSITLLSDSWWIAKIKLMRQINGWCCVSCSLYNLQWEDGFFSYFLRYDFQILFICCT